MRSSGVDRPPSDLTRRWHILSAITVALVAIAIRIWAFGGLTFGIGYDDGRYASVAKNLANGYLPTGDGDWFGTRIVLIWPVALFFRIFGTSDYTAVAWPLVGSLVGVLAAYLVGREVAGARVGLVASALVAVAPLDVLFATRLRPDSWMPALVALAVWCALRSRRGGSRWVAWAFAAGVTLGCAWSVRESAPLMVPVLAYILWPRGWRALTGAAVGALLVPVVAGLTFAAVGGGFSRPLTSTAGTAVWRSPVSAWDQNPSYLWMLWRDLREPRGLLFLLLPTIVLVAGLLLWRRPPGALVPTVWLIWVALYLEFGTLVNVAKPTRYLTLCVIPFAVLLSLAIESRWAFVGPVALAAVAIAALGPLPAREHRADDVVLLNRVASRLDELGPGAVLAEDYTWFVKLRAYRATTKLAVARVDEPTYLTPQERRRNRTLRQFPRLADFRGGFVVTSPPKRRRSGWPLNWGVFRRQVRDRVPFGDLIRVATVGDATIYRWPEAAAPKPPVR